MADMLVPIPYNLREADLVMDPITAKRSPSAVVELEKAFEDGLGDEALERMLRGAVLLFQRGQGTLGQCLETARIWETG